MQALMTVMQSLLSMNGSFGSIENGIATLKIDTAAIISSVSDVEGDISDVDSDISAVKKDTEAILGYMSGIGASLSIMDTDVAAVKNDTEAIIGSVSSVETDLSDVNMNIVAVKNDTETIIESISSVQTDISSINADITVLKTDTEAITDNLKDFREESAKAHEILMKGIKSLKDQLIHCTPSSDLSNMPSSVPSAAPTISNNQSLAPSMSPSVLSSISSVPSNVPSVSNAPTAAFAKLQELGDGTTTDTFTSVFVKKDGVALTNVAEIAAGMEHTCVILNPSNEMYCVGEEGFGSDRLGQMMDNKKIVKLTAGDNHYCTLLEDTTAKCFGSNYNGQLGNGSTTQNLDNAVLVLFDASTPLSGITDINAESDSTCLVVNGSPITHVTFENGVALSTSYGSSPSSWYKVTGTGGLTSAETVLPYGFDTKLHVYSGSCGSFTCIGGNNDDNGTLSKVTLDSVPLEEYYILVYGYSSHSFGPSFLKSVCIKFAIYFFDPVKLAKSNTICGAFKKSIAIKFTFSFYCTNKHAFYI
ncbi:hypothetical protein CTEN210_13704 [Chaetoceros tenuissimus]|uniref:Uncharacterized protein n=1 Tax=Chaetoceros tenuissimus TaxID=426638 RepID=A0AAD3HBN9_9STRA|nr:hypothetical protein CTEN210_13704 [Chaetoceros tenuissimus]